MTDYLDILKDFTDGPQKGLTSLFNRYGQSLYGYAVERWQLSEDESYDVLYKTLETAGKIIGRYEFSSEKHFENWLFKIHKSNLLQALRGKKTKDGKITFVLFSDWFQDKEDADDDGPADFVSPGLNNLSEDDLPATGALLGALKKSLESLHEKDRDLVLLKVSGYSYDEAAAMLGIENNQLKVKFLRLKNKLKQMTLNNIKQ